MAHKLSGSGEKYEADAGLDQVAPFVIAELSSMLRPYHAWKEWVYVLKDRNGDWMYRIREMKTLEMEKDPVDKIWHDLAQNGCTLSSVQKSLRSAKLIAAADFIAAQAINDKNSERSITDLRNDLQLLYRRTYQHFNPVPGNEHFIMELENMYTEIRLLRVRKEQRGTLDTKVLQRTAGLKDTLSVYELLKDVKEQNVSGQRILIEGEAGIGKSTLLQKITLDWTRHKLPIPFDLVFLLDGHSIEGPDVGNTLKVFFPQNLGQKVLNNSKLEANTLIMVDGYDEIPNAKENLEPLISGRDLSRCTVILTCRTNHATAMSKYFDHTVVALGYDEIAGQEYIRKYAVETNSAQKTFQVLSNFNEYPQFSELLRSPLYLLYLCVLVEDGHDIPSRRTDIYQSITKLTIEKTSSTVGITMEKCYEAFVELCKLALYGIQENKSDFEEDEIKSICQHIDLAIKFGFLSQRMSKSRLVPKQIFSFKHKTMLEFLAANCLRLMTDVERMQFLTERKDNKNLTMVLIFLCGLLTENECALDSVYRNVICKDLYKSLDKTTEEINLESMHHEYHLGLQCVGESGLFDTFRDLASRLVPRYYVVSSSGSAGCYYCMQGLQMALAQMELSHRPDVVLYGPHFNPFKPHKDIEQFQKFLSNCTFLQSLVLSNFTRVWGLIKTIHTFFYTYDKVEYLYIYMQPIPLSSVGLPKLEERDVKRALSNMKNLKTFVFEGLDVFSSEVTSLDLAEMEDILSKMLNHMGTSIKAIILQKHILNDKTAQSLESCVKRNLRLKTLCLIDTNLTDAKLSKILGHVGHLSKLYLKECAFTSEENSTALLSSLETIISNNVLLSFTLINVDLRYSNTTPLLEALSSVTTLQHFTIGGSIFREETKNKFLGALGKIKSLETLGMIQFGITKESLCSLTNAINCLTRLKKLQIAHDGIGNYEEFEMLGLSIRRNSSLKRLVLDDCGITDVNVGSICSMLQSRNIKELSLIGNSIGTTDSSIKQLFRGIAHCSDLTDLQLYLETSNFDNDLAEMLSGVLSICNTKLENLTIKISDNSDLLSVSQTFQNNLSFLHICDVSAVDSKRAGTEEANYHRVRHEQWRAECLAATN